MADCNCSICRRYGVLWAYYRPAQVKLSTTELDRCAWSEKKYVN